MNILKVGEIDPNVEEIHVDCGHQGYIRKLTKTELFTLQSIVISSNIETKNRILSVRGVLEKNSLTIKKSKKKLSNTTIERLRKNMIENVHKRTHSKQSDSNI